MDIMKQLAEEAAGVDAPESVTESTEGKDEPVAKDEGDGVITPPSIPGNLLLACCNDWDNTTSKKPEGLESPHLLDLGCPVSKCFSSSSSCFFFCLLSDGRLFGMGNNSHGQLGVGNTITQKSPCLVPTHRFPSPIAKVATGKHHSLLLLQNGDVYAAGSNTFGQCGLGSGSRATQAYSSFTKLPVQDVVDIACGWDHSLFCDKQGRLFAFGMKFSINAQ